MKYTFDEMGKSTAKEISRWQYEKPYSIYSMDGSEELIKELTNGTYYSVYENDKLIGYFCFGEAAQIPIGNEIGAYDDKDYLDIGLGLKPELCGKGYGYNFLKYGLDYAVDIYSKNKFRLTVARFNQRAIKVYKKIGFKENNVSFFRKGKNEDVEFIVMILEDRAVE